MIAARVYLRVSTIRQRDEGVSLATQLAAIEAYALLHFLTIIAIYQDVQSGKRIDRAQYTRLLEELQPGEHVLCWRLDRAGRDAEEMLRFGRLVRERKATLTFVAEPETSSPLIYGIKSVLAQEESARIRERTLPNMERVVAVEHRWVSKPPTWYRLEIKPRIGKARPSYGPGEGRLIPDEPYPGAAAACWEMVRATGNVSATARAFGLTYDALAGMLDNPAYVGTTRWCGIEVPDTHPALVPRALWDEVRAQRHGRRIPPSRRVDQPALLTGLLFRADTTERLHHRLHNPGTAWARGYYVSSAPYAVYVSVRADDADETVLGGLRDLRLTGAQAAALVRDAERAAARDRHARERTGATAKIAAIDRERAESARALLRGALTDAEMVRARAAQDAEEADQRAILAALPPLPDPADVRRRAEGRVGLARAVDNLWRDRNIPPLRALAAAYIARVELWGAEEHSGLRAAAKRNAVRNDPPQLHIVWLGVSPG
jgi:DNA invertase Pin-like site-specific DNA recombinase